MFLKRKENVLSGIILFLAYCFVRGEVLKICGGLILIMTLVMFMVLDSEGTKVFLKAIALNRKGMLVDTSLSLIRNFVIAYVCSDCPFVTIFGSDIEACYL